ncbi:Ig-like domain-containing protein [Robertmurraya sp. GLU-23]
MRKKWLMKCSNILVVIALLVTPLSNVVSAVTTDAGTPITTQFIPYENSEGQIMYDPTNEPGISPDEVDFTSGNDGRNEVGDKPSFYVYGDSDNLYFRMRLLGDPYDRKGGFLSSVWNVDILVDESHRATVGIDGKSPHEDYLFVASPDKEKVLKVTTTDSTGSAVPGTSISDAENGHYFLDFKIPISKIKEIIPDLDTSKPNVSFGFNTSKSANLRVINKDGLEAAEQGANVKLVPFGIYKPTILFDPIMTFDDPNPAISGITTNAVNGSTVTLMANSKTYTGTVMEGKWSIPTDLPTGTFNATATVMNEEGNMATAKSTIQIGKEISIDGPAVERLYKFPVNVTGKFLNSDSGNKQVELVITNVTKGGTVTSKPVNPSSNLWTVPTSFANTAELGEYTLQASGRSTGKDSVPVEANKIIHIIPPPTITTPVVEDGKLVVKGTGEKGETVELWVDEVLYKSVKVDDTTGDWTATVDTQLSLGTHTFLVKAYDDHLAVGQSLPVTYQTSNITVSIANGDSTVSNDPTPTIYGKTSVSNNGIVEVSIDNGPALTAMVNNGKWRLPLQTALTEGSHEISAVAKENGLTSAPDTQNLLLDLTTGVTLVSPTEYSKTNNIFTGTGEALGDVSIQVDDGPIKIINLKDVSETNTNWTFQTGELAYGTHTITISGMDELGNTKQVNREDAKITREFTIIDPTKPVPSNDNAYTIKNQAKSGELVVADQNIESLLYTIKSNGEKGTATIDATGNWTYEPNLDQLGEDRFIVEVTNQNGNKAEATITIQILELDVAINGLPGLRTDDHTPSFTGTAKKTINSVLTVQLLSEEGTEVTSAEVSMTENGDWQYVTPTLTAGKYTLKAVIRDSELGTQEVDTKSFTVYDASYKVTLVATPEKVVADGVSKVTLKAVVTDQDMMPAANETVKFAAEQGQLTATEAKTNAYGEATVELITPDYFGKTTSQTVIAMASVNNEEKKLQAEAPYLLTFVPAFVKGIVLDAITGDPITEASIRVNKTYEDGEIFTYQGKTDSLGNYVFPVKRGNTSYDVEISATTTVEGREVPISFIQSVKVDGGEETDFERKAERTVSGKVFVINPETDALQDIKTALGDVSIVPEIEHPTENIQIVPTESGQYKVTGGEIGKTYNVRFTIKHKDDIFAGKTVKIKIPEDGQATILPILIDPYGTVTNAKTNEIIEDAEVTLYWAETERNRLAGRVANTKVELPIIEGFAPNNNQNSQFTSTIGSYAWMVFPEGDYYIVSNKEGYYSYSSLEEGRTAPAKEGEDSFVEDGIIRVGYSMVNYDFKMEPLPVKEPESKNEAPIVTNDEVTTLKHTKVEGSAQAIDAEQDLLSYTLGTDGQNGKVTVTADGAWTYEPNLDFVGDDVFTILVNDQHNQSVPLTVVVHVVKPNLIITIDGGAEDRTVDHTPLLKGEALGMLQGNVDVVIKDKEGNTIEAESVPIENEKWTYQLKTETNPEEYLVEVTLKDSFYKEQTKTEQALTIVQVPLQMNLTATPQSVLGDGKAEVNLKAVITDESNEPIVNEKVTFRTELGTLKSTSVITNEKGEATVILVAPKLTDEIDPFNNLITVSVHNPDKGLVDHESINLEFIPNKAPVVTDDEVTTLKNTEVTQSSNVSDKENDALTYKVGTNAQHGQATVTSSGTWTYKPTQDFVGDDYFTLLVNDGNHEDVELKVIVHVVKPNLAITIDGGEQQTTVDRTPLLTGEVKEMVEGKVTVVMKDKDGRVIENSTVPVVNGKWSYQVEKELSPADFQVEANLTDSFYNETVKDKQTLTIAYIPLQIELTATPNSIVGDGKTEVTLKAVINNVFGEPIVNEKVSFNTELGTLKSAEAITNNKGEATVMLVAPDLTNMTDPITNVITVSVHNPDKGLVDHESINLEFIPNKAPVVTDDEVTTLKNTEVTQSSNVSDKENDALTYKLGTGAEHGLVTVTTSGTWTYKPTQDFVGDDSFTILVNDGNHEDVELEVTVHVVKPNFSITIDGGEQHTTVDRTPLLTGNVNEIVNGTVEVSIGDKAGQEVEKATVPVINGKWSYQVQKELSPDEYQVEANLTDSFYNETVKDNQTLTIAYIPLQIELTATPSSIVGDGKTEVTLKVVIKNSLGEPIANEKVVFDTELGTLKSTEATTNDKGEATVILVAPDLTGETTTINNNITVSVHNPDQGLVDDETITIFFIPNKAPSGTDDEVTTLKNTEVSRSVKATDKESDALTYKVGTNSEHGEATVTASGTWTYKPNKDFVGDDSFTLLVNDGYHSDVEMIVVVHVVKPNLAITIDGGEKQTFVDRTPLLTGEVKEAVEGKATIVIHDINGEMVETAPVNIVNGKWSHQVTKELIPADYEVEVTLTDTFYNETTKDNQVVTIANLPLQMELTATPSSIVGDGKTEVTLKAVIKNSLGEPIANEKVVFDTELGTLKSTEATTNDKGEATVILIAPDLSGNLQSIVKKVTASVNNPDKGLVDSKSVNITFVPARVSGQVIDSVTKKPVPNATITIKEDFNKDGVVDFETVVKTNVNGEYDIVVPKGNWNYKLQITTTMTVEGVEVPVTFTQDANVGETSGTGEQLKSDHTVIGQLFMENKETGKPESITSMVPGARFTVQPVDGVNIDITPTGQYIITGGEKGNSYTFAVTVIVKDKDGNDVILAGQKMTVTIPEDGVASIESTLIDPYGIVRDPDTLEPIEGVDMQLYWADTETNRKYGREPHTLVNLPILEDFAPNQNRNNQYTTSDGQYAWMVFADGDYYIIAKKDGYPVYDSRIEGRTVEALPGEDSYITNGIIHVGQTIVEYNMNMFSKLTETIEEPPAVEKPTTEESNPVAEAPIQKETPVKEEATPVTNLPIKVLPKTGSPFTTWTLLMLGTAFVVLGLVVRGRRKV